MAIIKNNINFGNQNIKRIYKGNNQITQIWKYEGTYYAQKNKNFMEFSTSSKLGFDIESGVMVYPAEFSLVVTDTDGTVISIKNVVVTTPSNYKFSNPQINGNTITFEVYAPAPEISVTAAIKVRYTVKKNKIDFQNKLLYYYGDGSQGLTYSDISVWKATVTNLGVQNPNNVTFDVTDYAFKPWSEVEFNGDTFIKFNKMYRKVLAVTDNQITSFSISNVKLDDDYVLYPCFIDEGGNELDYILVGKYMSKSRDTCNSVADGNPVDQTISNGREKARARGVGYQLMDWRIQRLWQDLVICASKKIRIKDNSSALAMDALGLYWGDASQGVDGFSLNNGTWIYSNSPSKYIDNPMANSEGYTAISGYTGPGGHDNIQKLGYDSNQPFFNYPSAINRDIYYSSYYCGAYHRGSTNTPISTRVGGPYSTDGVFVCFSISAWSSSERVRLCYRPPAKTVSFMPKLTVTGMTEVGAPISPLDIPERTFEFDDQNKIGTVVAVRTGAFKDAAASKIAGEVQISSTVETIGDNAFMNCSGITSVTMKTPYVNIGANAFSGDTSLSSFMIEDKTSNSNIGSFSIGDGAFNGCPLEAIQLGKNLKSIGENAFYRTVTGIKRVFIPDIYDFCKIDFMNQYSNPLNTSLTLTYLFENNYKGTATEITSISTHGLSTSSNGTVTLPALFQKCSRITSITIDSGSDTVVKVVYTNGSNGTRWSIPTLDILSCAVGSYFDKTVFSDSFETVRIRFASTWTAYDGSTIVATISPTGSTETNWKTFFNNNAAYKIQRTQ